MPSDNPPQVERRGRHYFALALILLIGAALRIVLAWVLSDQPLSIWDEQEYDQLAKTIATTGEYAFTPGGELTSLRPPLYPLSVAGVYKVAGISNFPAVRLMQAGLGLATTVLLYALGRLILDPKSSLWLAGMYCFYPSLLGFNFLVLTETMFTLLLITTCYCIIRTLLSGAALWGLAAGLSLGLAALTRSIVWLSPPLVAVYLLLTLRVNWPRRLLAAASVVIGFAAVVTPWAVRNTRLHETFVMIDVMGGRNFMMGNYQHTPFYRSWDAISITGPNAWDREVYAHYPLEQCRTQGMIDKLAMRRGLAFVMAHPGLTLQRDMIKFCDFWGLERELVAGLGRGYFGSISKSGVLILAAVICGSYAAVLFLGTYGALMTPLADRRVTWLLLLIIAYVCGLHTLTFGHSRYHLPLMPLVMVFAARAVTHLGEIWQRRRETSFKLATIFCVLVAASWVWMFFAVDRALLAGTVSA